MNSLIRSGYILWVCIVLSVVFGATAPSFCSPAPHREVRAAWVTTINGLDWPSSTERAQQQRELIDIVSRLHALNFNTIYFQVRGRGDAMYRSSIEPWSAELTGELGRSPGWDPLELLIRESHRYGMEVHAWFNVFLVRTLPRIPESAPRHVTLAHPEWVHNVEGEWWLNPGLPEVRYYVSDVVLDLVRTYDIDGIQFDYLRYPARQLPDEGLYRRAGSTLSRDEWRRGNVNSFLQSVADSIHRIRPMMKIGAAPIGIYNEESFPQALHSFGDLYQDSRRWLLEGWVDYLAPQLYWPLKSKKDEPGFLLLARDWAAHRCGRQIVPGIGIYKKEIMDEAGGLIDAARNLTLDGQAFFRYTFLKNVQDLKTRYATPVLVPTMKWRDTLSPPPPKDLHVSTMEDHIVQISWSQSASSFKERPVARYAVYRSPVTSIPTDSAYSLIAVLPGSERVWIDTIRHPVSGRYSYAVSSLDRWWNESTRQYDGIFTLPEVVQQSAKYTDEPMKPSLFADDGFNDLTICVDLNKESLVTVEMTASNQSSSYRIFSGMRSAGRAYVTADIRDFPKGYYKLNLIVENESWQIPFTIER